MINTGEHIVEISDRVACGKHEAPKGEPCWVIPIGHGSNDSYKALCGQRVRHAGYTGAITQSSFVQNKRRK